MHLIKSLLRLVAVLAALYAIFIGGLFAWGYLGTQPVRTHASDYVQALLDDDFAAAYAQLHPRRQDIQTLEQYEAYIREMRVTFPDLGAMTTVDIRETLQSANAGEVSGRIRGPEDKEMVFKVDLERFAGDWRIAGYGFGLIPIEERQQP